MNNFPKRKVLLGGFMALFLGAVLPLPAMAASEENEAAATEQAKGHPMEHREHHGAASGGEHKMGHEEHEKMMEDMHGQHMDKKGMDHGQMAPDDEEGDYEEDDSEE